MNTNKKNDTGNYKIVTPAGIESESMRIINTELATRGIVIPNENLAVVRRVIHTTADFDYAENLKFTPGATGKAVRLLRDNSSCRTNRSDDVSIDNNARLTFITDTNMALSGISKPTLARMGAGAVCYMADEDIKIQAKSAGTTRAYASMKRAGKEHPHGIFVSGNAPTALIAISEMIREGLRPSLVIGVPVGFVNVSESKEELFNVCMEYSIPAIVAFGRKGGSNVAASICNALLYSAAGTLDPAKRI